MAFWQSEPERGPLCCALPYREISERRDRAHIIYIRRLDFVNGCICKLVSASSRAHAGAAGVCDTRLDAAAHRAAWRHYCRAGAQASAALKLPLQQALIFSLIGNIIPIPFILLFIRKIFDWLRPTKHFGKLVQKMEARAMKKSDGVSKAEFWGLVAFVGIPLPGTGGWTGALIASLLDVDIKKASLAILVGIAVAATIMSLIFYGVLHM